jgi:lysophospholipase L1-like esterase
MFIRKADPMRIFVFIIALVTGGTLFELSLCGIRLYYSFTIAQRSASYERKTSGAAIRLLIAGDSTGVGTGASSATDSVAGRIARDFPGVEIINLSRNGAKVKNVIEQLESIQETGFDIILFQIGGNDILGFTDLNVLEKNMQKMLKKASEKGKHIILISTGNVGLAPALFPPFTWIYTARTLKARDVFIKATSAAGAEYIDLFREGEDDPFSADTKKYYARDFLHPSSEGYRIWYEELRHHSSLVGILSR